MDVKTKPEKGAFRLQYRTPAITRYGTILELTQTADGPYSDNDQKNCNHDGPNVWVQCGSLGADI